MNKISLNYPPLLKLFLLVAVFVIGGTSASAYGQCSAVSANSINVSPLFTKAIINFAPSGASSYFVRYRSLDGTESGQKEAQPGSPTTVILEGLTSGKTYGFKVFARCPGRAKGSKVSYFTTN